MAPQNDIPSRRCEEPDSAPEDREPVTVLSDRDSTRSDSNALATTVERERLRARICTLERELAASERHRQGLIDQYEQLLAAREEATDAGTDDRSRLRQVLAPRR